MNAATLENAALAGLRALPDWRGKAGIALKLKRLRERRGALNGGWDLRLSDGSLVRLPRGSQMTWSVAATGYWDRHVVEFVARHIDSETIAVDIGASLGLWTLPLARAARAIGGRLWCFEPNPENMRWLAANIDRNGLSGVVDLHPIALGSRPGTARLGFREHGGGNGALVDGNHGDAIEVPVERLDGLDFPRRVSFIKMDVEGFELEVIRGASGLVERDRPVIFGEFNPNWLRERGEDLAGELLHLRALGYDVFTLGHSRSRQWRPNDIVTPRRLYPPFAVTGEDLLLIPS
jgi:FkbM family methyltransferase